MDRILRIILAEGLLKVLKQAICEYRGDNLETSHYRREQFHIFTISTFDELMEGKCLLCGKYGALTFEHVPPQCAFNSKPIFIQNGTHLTETSSPLYGKRMRSNRGFGSNTLCKKCNNETGAWYGKDFCDFAKQGLETISNQPPAPYVVGIYRINPLNVLKQILTMFMSSDKTGHLLSFKPLTDFILNKDSLEYPEAFKVYIYSNISSVKRMFGPSTVFAPSMGIQRWAEINFQPFGYLLAEDSRPAHQDMVDITEFSNYQYNQMQDVMLTTRYLSVSSPFIGIYN